MRMGSSMLVQMWLGILLFEEHGDELFWSLQLCSAIRGQMPEREAFRHCLNSVPLSATVFRSLLMHFFSLSALSKSFWFLNTAILKSSFPWNFYWNMRDHLHREMICIMSIVVHLIALVVLFFVQCRPLLKHNCWILRPLFDKPVSSMFIVLAPDYMWSAPLSISTRAVMWVIWMLPYEILSHWPSNFALTFAERCSALAEFEDHWCR
jgi:hypothetical protein